MSLNGKGAEAYAKYIGKKNIMTEAQESPITTTFQVILMLLAILLLSISNIIENPQGSNAFNLGVASTLFTFAVVILGILKWLDIL